MRSEWKDATLCNFLSFKNGKKPIVSDKGYPLYGGNGVYGYSDSYNEKNSVVVGRVGAYCGSVHYEPNKYWVSDNAISVNAEGHNSILYAYYLLQYLQLNKRQIGTSQPLLTQGILKSIKVQLPPPPTQQAIAATLSCLDAKIEVNNKINENLERQAQAIFKSWFVDFEPFQDGGFVESELGMIPKGWVILSFGDFIAPRVERDNNPDTPTYSVTNTGIHLRESIFNKRLSSARTRNKVLYEGDLVFGMSRKILNWGIMRDRVGEVSSAYHVYRVNQAIVESWYLELFITQQLNYFSNLIRPASREGQGIDRELLSRKQIYIPSEEWLIQYNDVLMTIKRAIRHNNKYNSTLSALRDALLPKLMSGEIEVPIVNQ